jgi:hypothetical protein
MKKMPALAAILVQMPHLVGMGVFFGNVKKLWNNHLKRRGEDNSPYRTRARQMHLDIVSAAGKAKIVCHLKIITLTAHPIVIDSTTIDPDRPLNPRLECLFRT